MKKLTDFRPQGEDVVKNNMQNVDPDPQVLMSVERDYGTGTTGSTIATKTFQSRTITIPDTPCQWTVYCSADVYIDVVPLMGVSGRSVRIELHANVRAIGGEYESIDSETGVRTHYSALSSFFQPEVKYYTFTKEEADTDYFEPCRVEFRQPDTLEYFKSDHPIVEERLQAIPRLEHHINVEIDFNYILGQGLDENSWFNNVTNA